jgi:hypothetical protein
MRNFKPVDRPPLLLTNSAMNSLSESNAVDKKMHERSTEKRPRPPVRVTVKDAMMKRDSDVDTATSALRAAADDVTSCVAELMHLVAPKGASAPVDWRGGAADRIDACKQFGLVGEIHDVTFQLRALQRAAELATRRARRRAAEESARREDSGN